MHADACIELETNRYSVPWRLIGETVTVLVNEQVRILHAGQEAAVHTQLAGQRRTSIQREHCSGFSLDAKLVRELATCRWVGNGDALLLLEPPGVGKAHLAAGLGREAIQHGYSTLFTSATALVTR